MRVPIDGYRPAAMALSIHSPIGSMPIRPDRRLSLINHRPGMTSAAAGSLLIARSSFDGRDFGDEPRCALTVVVFFFLSSLFLGSGSLSKQNLSNSVKES